MKKTPYGLGLLCLAVLVLMPDITVNAQPVPSEQGPNGQMPNEKTKAPIHKPRRENKHQWSSPPQARHVAAAQRAYRQQESR